MAEDGKRTDASRDRDNVDPDRERPRTKKELARRSDGDETGGEEFGRGAPVDDAEQFQEYAGTEGASDEPDREERPRRPHGTG